MQLPLVEGSFDDEIPIRRGRSSRSSCSAISSPACSSGAPNLKPSGIYRSIQVLPAEVQRVHSNHPGAGAEARRTERVAAEARPLALNGALMWSVIANEETPDHGLGPNPTEHDRLLSGDSADVRLSWSTPSAASPAKPKRRSGRQRGGFAWRATVATTNAQSAVLGRSGRVFVLVSVYWWLGWQAVRRLDPSGKGAWDADRARSVGVHRRRQASGARSSLEWCAVESDAVFRGERSADCDSHGIADTLGKMSPLVGHEFPYVSTAHW